MVLTNNELRLPLEDSPFRIDRHGPIFILGCPRSGTTYLSRCIAGLPGVSEFIGVLAPPRMMHLVGSMSEQGDDTGQVLNVMRDIFWQSFWRRRLFRGERLLEQAWKRSVSGLLKKPTLEGTWFCYKEPFLCFAASEVAEAFPNAKFLHIIRDGRDNADSLERKYPDALADHILHEPELVENKNSEVGIWRPFDGWCIPWWVDHDQEQAFVAASRYGRCVWMWKEMVRRACSLRGLGETRYHEVRY